MNNNSDPNAALVSWVRQAAPYIHTYRGKIFVIAVSGSAIASPHAQTLIHDIALLDSMGIRLVLVHGARWQIDAELKSRGLKSKFHNGLRITDAATLECVKRSIGVTRIELEALLSQGQADTPLAGAFLRITGGNFVSAKPLGVVDGIDFEYTGTVRNIIAEEICADLSQENVVLISPIASSPSGEIFNLAWEEVAASVADAISADKLIFMCDGLGLVDKRGKLQSALTADEAERLLKRKVPQSTDIQNLLPWALRACRGSVGRVHCLPLKMDGAMLMEIFTHQGVGTLITNAPLAHLRIANYADLESLRALIAPLEADGTLVRRNEERLKAEIKQFVVIEHDGIIAGCAALYPIPHTRAAELACLAVRSEYRRQGFGERLRLHIEKHAKALRFKSIFVLTTRTAHWFQERGYVLSSVEDLPPQRRSRYNFSRRSKIFIKSL